MQQEQQTIAQAIEVSEAAAADRRRAMAQSIMSAAIEQRSNLAEHCDDVSPVTADFEQHKNAFTGEAVIPEFSEDEIVPQA